MASRNGTGTFTRSYDWTDDAANSIPITASRFDEEMDGVASELTNSVAADGQTTMSGALKMGGQRITNVGDATAVTDAPRVDQIQDNDFGYIGSTSGTTTAYTLSPSPAVAALVKGQEFAFEVNADNTASSTLAISGLTATTFKKLDAAGAKQNIDAGDLQANITYKARYDGTDFLLIDQIAVTNASTTIAGLIEIATNAEALAGSDTTRAVTSAGLASDKSLATSGYYVLPGGLKVQWGYDAGATASSGTVNFPTTFTAVYTAICTPRKSSGAQYVSVSAITTSNFSYKASSVQDGLHWIAIGTD